MNVWGDIRADKARDFIGKRRPGGEQQGEGAQGELLCHVACSLRFYGNGVSFRFVSGQLSCSAPAWSGPGSFLVACASLSQDGFQRQGSWEVGCLLPPIGNLPKSSRLVFRAAPGSLSGPPAVRQLIQTAIIMPGLDGQF